MNDRRKIEIIGAPIGIASGSIGASLGPDAIRLAGLHEQLQRLHWTYEDRGNLDALEEPYPGKDFRPGENTISRGNS